LQRKRKSDVPGFKRPESILVVVYTLRGEVLLLRRRRPRWFWQSVTGSLRWDEDAPGAAARELREETGLRAHGRLTDCQHSERFLILAPWRERYAPGATVNREHWFALALPDRRLIRLHPKEHVQLRWMPWPQAARLASSWTNRKAIQLLADSG